MSLTLRILLILFSLLYFGYTIYKIRKSTLNIEDAIFPILFSLICVFMSLFTKVIVIISNKLGFMSVTNFVIVFLVFILSLYNLKLLTKYSKLNEKLKNLNHEIAFKEKGNKND